MVQIKFVFPKGNDAVNMHMEMEKFFTGSSVYDKNVTITSVEEDTDEKNKSFWYFYVNISNGDDTSVEKYKIISGGTFNVMNGDKQVWAFA